MKNHLCNRRSTLRGATALEFALVFPILFLMMYGMLSYALIFAAQHSLSDAAAEAGRVAVRFSGSPQDKNPIERGKKGCDIAMPRVAWVAKIGGGAVNCDVDLYDESCPLVVDKTQCISVSVRYNYQANPLIPRIPLLPTPNEINGTAITQIALSY